MKKCIILLLLAGCLLSSSALAANDTTDNFIRVKTYSGEFSDLAPDSTFYANISALYEYGLSVGKVDGTYGLEDPLTVGQAVIFAGRIRSLYRTGDPEAGAAAYKADNQPLAATPYLLYLQAEDVIGTELDNQLTAPATRAQMAHVLANVLPEETLPFINNDIVFECYATRRFISDVTEYTPYYQDILKLYRQGISQGSNANGTFRPDAYITRGAAAAMLTRIIDPDLRITLTWTPTVIPSVSGRTLSDLVPESTYIASPATTEELTESIAHMLYCGSNQLILQYNGITAIKANQIMREALTIIKTYCEQSYNSVSCTYTLAGNVTLTFSAAGAGEDLPAYRADTMAAALSVRNRLWAEGTLNTDMTQLEIAKAYYTWICENCVYDYEADDTSLSHIAYNLFKNGTAVCDGYTSAYNLLLKLEGIDCCAIITDNHIWTEAVLDGTRYHIDTTWGDNSAATITYLYFAMTPEQSALYHNHPI